MSVANSDQLDISYKYKIDPVDVQPKAHKIKIFLLFALPFIFFVIAAIAHIARLTSYAEQLTELDLLTSRAIELSNLLHESQKERGMTGIYLASSGNKFVNQLKSQQQLTDGVSEQASQLMLEHKGGELSRAFQGFRGELDQLPAIREKVKNLTISTREAIAFYSQLNLKILKIISEMAKENVEPELNRKFLVYVNFLKKKEIVGIERALLSAVFTENKFTPENYKYFVKLVTEQELLQREFLGLASPELKQAFHQLTQSQVYQEVQQYRNLAHGNMVSGGFGVDASDWFRVITEKINKLKWLENQIAAELIAKSKNIKAVSEREKLFWLITLLGITLLAMIGGLLLIRNINLSFLRRLEAYRLLFENSSAGMVVVNSNTKNILYCNTSFARMTGCDQDKVSQCNIVDFHPKELSEHVAEQFDRLVKGQTNLIEKLMFENRDGRQWYAEVSAFPLLVEGHSYVAANIKDISAKVTAEEKLQKSEQTLQTVLDSLSSAVTVIDANDHQILYLNKKANEIYQAKAEVEPVWSLLAPGPSPSLNPEEHHLGLEFSEQVFNKSRKRWYQITNKVIDWFDNRVVYLRKLEDITERYEIEHKNQNLLVEIRKLSLRNYSLQEVERKQLAAELHDQLGQLMTGIRLQADFIHQSMQGKHQEVEASIQSIIKTTQELITSVQGITNQLRPVLLDQLDLAEALRELIQQWQQLNKEIRFDFNAEPCPDTLPDQVAINVYRIVQESLTNACKHARASQVTVSLKFEHIGEQNSRPSLVLNISDDGIGFNVNDTHYHGMGLVNMRERVEALGGVFRLLTKSGKGVNTHAFIPLKDDCQEPICH